MNDNEIKSAIEKYVKEMMHAYSKAVPANASISDSETYEQFLKENPQIGSLKVQAFTAQQALPVKNVNILVTKKFLNEEKIFYDLYTDEDGIIDGMTLPAPDKKFSEDQKYTGPIYATYDIKGLHPQYETVEFEEVTIFDGVKSIQPVSLVPKK